MDDLARFHRLYIPEPNSGCWLWLGALNEWGYPRFSWNGKRGYAHRASLELLGVVIGDGLDVDHLCRVRCCVNPEHLEPVTRLENNHRSILARSAGLIRLGSAKDRCVYGHEMAVGGGYFRKNASTPACMECARESRRKYYRKFFSKNETQIGAA